MQKYLYLAVIYFLFISSLHAQTSWQLVTPYPFENPVRQVTILPDNTFLGIAAYGSIIKSTDNGNSWKTDFAFNNELLTFTRIYFINNNTGWILSENGKILKTTNKGENWLQQESYINFGLNNIEFLNTNTGYISGGGGTILKTTDAGSNWYFKGIKSQTYGMGSFTFINDRTGFVCAALGYNHIVHQFLKTTNSGDNWDTVAMGNSNNNSYHSIAKIDSSNLILLMGSPYSSLTTHMSVFKSSNAGLNWNKIYSDTTISPSFFKIKNGICWFIGYTSSMSFSTKKIFKSLDYGHTWIQTGNMPPENYYNNNSYFDINAEGKLWFINGYDIYHSTNEGVSWTKTSREPLPSYENKLYFVNENTGYLSTSGTLRTTNSGITWDTVDNFGYREIKFINEQTGYYTKGDSINHLSKTTNGGLNFTNIITGYNAYLYHIDYYNNMLRISGTERAHSYHYKLFYIESSNGGLNWTKKTQDNWLDEPPSYIKFFGTTGYLFSHKNLFKTTNNGLTWNPLSLNHSNFGQCQFLNANTGWLTSNYKALYKTTNGGLNWDSTSFEYFNINQTVYKFQFVNENTGWIVAAIFDELPGIANYNGRPAVFKTTNSGQSWNMWKFNTVNNWPSISMINENTGFISAQKLLYKTTNGGVISINNSNSSLPEKHILFQNYPNPFNPNTKIEFSIKTTGLVKLKVYDLTGRLVSTLINKNLIVGSYNIDFDASNLSSGVYFYSLEVNGFYQTKKMILIK